MTSIEVTMKISEFQYCGQNNDTLGENSNLRLEMHLMKMAHYNKMQEVFAMAAIIKS